MIDVKEAVKIAKREAQEVLEQPVCSLEEIERDSYRDREVWSITLGFPLPKRLDELGDMRAMFSRSRLEYKRFLIAVDNGEMLAMKLREPVTQ
jgi:hypothetical protein